MMKTTQTTAAVPDTFLRSLCGRAPEAKRLPSFLGHRLGTIRDHGVFILAIALLAFGWLTVPAKATILPSLVTASMATATSSSQVTLRWNSSTDTGGPGLAAYQVFRDGILVGTTTATAFTDSTVAPSTSYCYTIIAVDIGGNDAPASAEACITTPSTPPGNPTGPGFYVDYSAGSDSNPGTNGAAPWKHVPGDPLYTGSGTLTAGNTVFFKGGEAYIIGATHSTAGAICAGIVIQPGVTYDGNSAGTWGSGPAVITDYGATNYHAAFYWAGNDLSNVTWRGFNFTGIGGVGTNRLPADTGTELAYNGGYGMYITGRLVGCNIISCTFSNIGYWQNVKPSGFYAIAGNAVSPAAVQVVGGAINTTFSNNTIVCVHGGFDIVVSSLVSNLTECFNTLGNYTVWPISFQPISGGTMDYTYVHDNTFENIGGAYSATYDTAYESGDLHQDPIFDEAGESGYVNGTNIDFYNNTFTVGAYTSGAVSADIWLEGGTSANIHNNLFNTPLLEKDADVFVYSDVPGATSFCVRVVNNTFIDNVPNNSISPAFGIDMQSAAVNYVWPSNNPLLVANNIAYSFFNIIGGWNFLVSYGPLTNRFPITSWTVDYNDWHADSGDPWWICTGGATNASGGLGTVRGYGMDLHSTTNDPQFVSLAYGASDNSSLNNYQLQAGSPAIGAGTNLSKLNLPGLAADISGVLRPATGNWDLGAYQH
jgi:hypothetical protein